MRIIIGDIILLVAMTCYKYLRSGYTKNGLKNMSVRRQRDYVIGVLVVIVIILAGAVGFLYGRSLNPMTQTITIHETTTQTITSTIKTTTCTSTVTSDITSSSFSYSPNSPLEIKSVQAITSRAENGDRYVTFAVECKNIGDSTVYIVGGCGSGLYLFIPTDSVVLQKVPSGPECLCAEFIMPLYQDQNHTSIVPGCWSGYAIKLLSPGKGTIDFAQYWSTSASGAQNVNYTSITASFTFI
jgi:hypothetical protein